MESVSGVKNNSPKRMAKRLTDTEKYKKAFFKKLSGPYKLLWDYLYHNCDNAGIWIKDFEIAQIYIGSDMPINEGDALKFFAGRVVVFDKGNKWFVPGFIEFQYDCSPENLNPKNNAHLSVIKKLKKEGLYEGLLGGALDKDKDKDKDIVMDKDKYITVANEKIFDPMPILEFYEASLNGRQKEQNLTNWRIAVPEWFEQNIKMDFNDQKHVLNTFSKYIMNKGSPVNGKGKTGLKKLTIEELDAP